jgi:hypothetical protein
MMRLSGCGLRLGSTLRAGALGLALASLGAGQLAAADNAASPFAPSGWLRLRTTGYRFQTEDADGATLDRLGAYQEFDGAASGLAGGRLALRLSGRFADDLYLKERVTERSRLYTGHLEARPLAHLTARLGRQFIQEGPAGLTLDGLWLAYRVRPGFETRIWGGAGSPLTRAFEAGSLEDAAAWGARLMASPRREVRLAASWGYRERDGRVASRLLGFETGVTPVRGMRATGRVAYDLAHDAWDRADIIGQWQPRGALPMFIFQYVDRNPRINANSYFVRFTDAKRMRLARAAARYEHASRFGAELECLDSFVGKRTSARVGATLLTPYGQVGYSARLGDSGEESRWFGDVAWRARPWLSLEGGATFLTYALLADAPQSEERDLTTLFGRVRMWPRAGLGLTLELQRLENPFYTKDVRFLAGLDLAAGCGAGCFGLSRGGCCR